MNNPELHQFVRMHPYWYRKLGREPQSLNQLQEDAKLFYGKTVPQKLERLNNNLKLAMMFMQMLQPGSGGNANG